MIGIFDRLGVFNIIIVGRSNGQYYMRLEFLDKVEMVRLIKKFIYSVIHRFFVSDSMWRWRWNLIKMEVEEQWKREKRVVDEKERLERKIYLFFILETDMKCYK